MRHTPKEKIVEGIKEGFEQVKLYKQGQLKLKSAKDLLFELDKTQINFFIASSWSWKIKDTYYINNDDKNVIL